MRMPPEPTRQPRRPVAVELVTHVTGSVGDGPVGHPGPRATATGCGGPPDSDMVTSGLRQDTASVVVSAESSRRTMRAEDRARSEPAIRVRRTGSYPVALALPRVRTSPAPTVAWIVTAR